MNNTANNHEKTVLRCAVISMICLLVAAVFWALLMNDGSIDKDWITDSYFRKLVVMMWTGFMAFTGLLISLINVGGYIVLLKNRIRSKRLFVLNSITPMLSVTFYMISTYVDSTMPNF